jgi:hypothetical protein
VRAEADALLDRRQNPQWVSLSWVAVRPLISSLNEVLCQVAPSLVPQLRDFWLTRVPATGEQLALSRHVDRRDETAFIVIGDTGEQDRSQYIVAPVLRRVAEGPPPDPPDGGSPSQRLPGFAVICSDVLYPSGDVNGYVHGVYLPYGPRPGSPGEVTRLEQLPLLAIPGNHDWHDGLAAFMQHFCGTGPLPSAEIGWPAAVGDRTARWQEGLTRLLWRRPVAARPQRFWRWEPGRPAPVLGDGEPAPALRTVEEQRRLRRLPESARQPEGALPPLQPGSYFSVQIDGLLVVAIDTGIGLGAGDSAVDARQGRWLLEVSRLPGPKVLLTGNPLLVNAQWKVCWLGGPPGEASHAPAGGYRTVNEIIADPALGYVAAIGGDIHNFQHTAQLVGPGGGHLVHYIVSGGGGAYMSATHPIPVVAARSAGTSTRDTREVAERNRRTGGAAAGDAGGSNHARLVEGPIRLIPAPAESLAHYARLVLPKLWRLERGLLAFLAGIGLGYGVSSADPAHPGRDLTAAAGALAALLVVRTVFGQPLTRRLFRLRDPEHSPLNRAYRAAVVVTAGVSGAAVSLAGAYVAAGSSWARHLLSWLALTVVAAVVAALLRYTGWWRAPVPRDQETAAQRLVAGTAAWLACTAAAWGLGRLLPAGPRQWVPAAVVVAVGITGRLFSWWWRPVVPTVGSAWGRRAPLVSYLIQAIAAMVILSGAVFGHDWWLPSATVLGVLALAAVLALSFAIAAGVVRLAAAVSGGPGGWRSGWGLAGGAAPWLTGVLAVALVGAQLALALGSGLTAGGARAALAVLWLGPLALVTVISVVLAARRSGLAALWTAGGAAGVVAATAALILGAGAAAPDVYRQTLSTQLALGSFLAVVLLVDELRRRTRGVVFTVSAVLVALAPIAATWALDRATAWTLRAALVPVVGALQLLVTVVVAHLVFLGAQYLVFDLAAHAGSPGLLTLGEAEAFLRWRSVEAGAAQLTPRALRRARIVFPTTDSPHGPIQEKVSEIFDSDFPPFWKDFLVLRTEQAPGGARRLRIDVHVVRGTGTVDAEAAPVAPSILIDLPS